LHHPSSIFLLAFIAFYSLLHILTWAMSHYRRPAAEIANLAKRVGERQNL
jgi:hypothetical protein